MTIVWKVSQKFFAVLFTFAESDEHRHPDDHHVEEGLEPESCEGVGVGWSRPHEDDAAEVIRNAFFQLPVAVAAVRDVEVGLTDPAKNKEQVQSLKWL